CRRLSLHARLNTSNSSRTNNSIVSDAPDVRRVLNSYGRINVVPRQKTVRAARVEILARRAADRTPAWWTAALDTARLRAACAGRLCSQRHRLSGGADGRGKPRIAVFRSLRRHYRAR